MSAYMVDKAHIDAMIYAGLQPGRYQGEHLCWNLLPDHKMAELAHQEWGKFSFAASSTGRHN